jgi:hypothetical protein
MAFFPVLRRGFFCVDLMPVAFLIGALRPDFLRTAFLIDALRPDFLRVDFIHSRSILLTTIGGSHFIC